MNKPKSNSVITSNVIDGKLVIAVNGHANLVVDPTMLSAPVRERALFHGLNARIIDAAAKSRDSATGKPAPTVDKYNAMKALVEHYISGSEDWSPKRSERTGSTDSLLTRCLGELFPNKSADELRAFVTSKTKVERDAMLLNANIKAIADRIRAEQTSTVNSDALLEELMA